jgi:hypothetical protein
MPPRHPQVPVLDFLCDEEIAELIALMNRCGITTLLSCQDSNLTRGTVRRVRVQIFGQQLLPFLGLLDRPEEISDLESLSNRIEPADEPDDWEAFRENRCWHYGALVKRLRGELVALEISVDFPYTDLAEVVARLRTAAREIAGVPVMQAAPDGSPLPRIQRSGRRQRVVTTRLAESNTR